MKALAVLMSLAWLLLPIGVFGQKASSSEGGAVTPAQGYPLQTSKTLTYWVMLNGNLGAVAKNVADTPF